MAWGREPMSWRSSGEGGRNASMPFAVPFVPLPVAKEMAPLVEETWLHKFLRSWRAGFFSGPDIHNLEIIENELESPRIPQDSHWRIGGHVSSQFS